MKTKSNESEQTIALPLLPIPCNPHRDRLQCIRQRSPVCPPNLCTVEVATLLRNID